MTFMTSTSFFFFKSDLVDDYIYIYMGNNSYYNGSDLCPLECKPPITFLAFI